MRRYGICREEYFQIVDFITTDNKSKRIMGWISGLLERSDATEEEFGPIISVLETEKLRRTLIGPFSNVRFEKKQIMEDISMWIRSLRALDGKRKALQEFFMRIFGDLEMSQLERDLLTRRLQNARRKKFPAFKWKSEVLRQLRKFEKQPAHRLYNWAAQGERFGIEIPDLLRIVSEMKKRNIPDGPSMVTLDAMRRMNEPQNSAPPVAPPPEKKPELTHEDYMRMLRPVLGELASIYDRNDPAQLLEFVFRRHTPKGPLPLPNQDFRSGILKKHIQKALRCYHPDKQALYGDFGPEWVILCNEITKFLTKCLQII